MSGLPCIGVMWECRRGGWLMLEREGSIMVSSAAGRCAGLRSDEIELSRFGRGLSGVEDVRWFSWASEKLRFLLGPGYGLSVRWSSADDPGADGSWMLGRER